MAAASPTTWHPRTTIQPKSWLLTNGEVVTEPPLEETASGRKVRITGTTTSMFSKDVDELIYQGVQSVAKSKGEQVWMALDDKERKQAEVNVYGNSIARGTKPTLHMLKAGGSTSGSGQQTTAWWRFRHPSLPIEAVVVLQMSPAYSGYGRNNNTNQDVRTALLMPTTIPSQSAKVSYIHSVNNDMNEWTHNLSNADHRLRFQEMLRDNKPNWAGDVRLRQDVIAGDRLAVKAFLDDVQAMEAFEKFDVPDLRDPSKPTWLTLDLQDTNVTGEFIQSLKDYLDGGSVVEEVKKHWDEITRLMRSAGLVLEDKDEASFSTALAGGEPVTITVQSPPNEAGHMVDHSHSVVLHLPTGTMIVNCAKSDKTNKDEIATKWDEALTMASLTGQEDTLLAYARRFAETANERRTEQIMSERKTK